ncbi:MAG: hypothetical protein ACR2IK_19925 [Chloroflexota bacterium]
MPGNCDNASVLTWMLPPLVAGLVLLGIVPEVLQAQSGPHEEMQQVGFLEGQWQGDGWIAVASGRQTFVETETVTWKLSGAALLIEGRGTHAQPAAAEPIVVHDALAVLTYNASAERYDFRAYQADGGAVNADASVVDGTLVWGFQPDPTAPTSIRYTISVSDAGEWHEVGELSPDGQAWRQFFEMTLHREPAGP